MRLVFWGLLLGFFAPATAFSQSESDALVKTVAFALTANDETTVKPIDQGDCVFRVNNEVYHLNNVRLDRIRFQDQKRTFRGREHRVTLVYVSGEAAGQERVYEGLDENNNQLPEEVL